MVMVALQLRISPEHNNTKQIKREKCVFDLFEINWFINVTVHRFIKIFIRISLKKDIFIYFIFYRVFIIILISGNL